VVCIVVEQVACQRGRGRGAGEGEAERLLERARWPMQERVGRRRIWRRRRGTYVAGGGKARGWAAGVAAEGAALRAAPNCVHMSKALAQGPSM